MTTGEAVLVDPLSDLVAHNVWVVRMVCDAFCVCQRGGFTEQAEEFVRFWRTREFGQDILEEPCFGPLFELLSGIRALLSFEFGQVVIEPFLVYGQYNFTKRTMARRTSRIARSSKKGGPNSVFRRWRRSGFSSSKWFS